MQPQRLQLQIFVKILILDLSVSKIIGLTTLRLFLGAFYRCSLRQVRCSTSKLHSFGPIVFNMLPTLPNSHHLDFERPNQPDDSPLHDSLVSLLEVATHGLEILEVEGEELAPLARLRLSLNCKVAPEEFFPVQPVFYLAGLVLLPEHPILLDSLPVTINLARNYVSNAKMTALVKFDIL